MQTAGNFTTKNGLGHKANTLNNAVVTKFDESFKDRILFYPPVPS